VEHRDDCFEILVFETLNIHVLLNDPLVFKFFDIEVKIISDKCLYLVECWPVNLIYKLPALIKG